MITLKQVSKPQPTQVLWHELKVGEVYESIGSTRGICLKISSEGYFSFTENKGYYCGECSAWPCKRVSAQLNWKYK